MGQPGRRVFIDLLKAIVDSLKPRTFRGELVGKDYFGNSYYQIKATSRQKAQRWFEPKEKDNFEQELPAEWESWLRNRRKETPSEEEVLANAALAKQKKINAANLEAGRKPAEKPQIQQPAKGYDSFPTYEEYEIFPGKKKKGEF